MLVTGINNSACLCCYPISYTLFFSFSVGLVVTQQFPWLWKATVLVVLSTSMGAISLRLFFLRLFGETLFWDTSWLTKSFIAFVHVRFLREHSWPVFCVLDSANVCNPWAAKIVFQNHFKNTCPWFYRFLIWKASSLKPVHTCSAHSTPGTALVQHCKLGTNAACIGTVQPTYSANSVLRR